MIWLFACYGPGDYSAGPEVFDEPLAEHEGDDWLFTAERINRIDLEVDEDAQEILRAQRRMSYPRDKVRVEAWVDDEELGEIGLRMRGGLGSFTRFDEKPKWELDFNEYSGERFHGLESLSLNNMVSDCSSIRETVAAAAYTVAGVPSSRTGYAQLFVNGQDYGLYTVIETQDDRWLKDHFATNDGTFYDGKYQYKGGVVPYMVDFGLGRDHWFDLEEGEEGDRAEIGAISAAVEDSLESGRMDPALWELVDWEQVLRLTRAEQFTGDDDGIAGLPNNYRVYFQPGLPMAMSRWDLDGSLRLSEGQVAFNAAGWEEPGSRLLQVCFADEDCLAIWDELGPEVEEALLDGRLHELATQASTLTEEAAVQDPRRECGPRLQDQREAILDYLLTGEEAEVDWEEEDCSHSGRGGLLATVSVLAGLLMLRARSG